MLAVLLTDGVVVLCRHGKVGYLDTDVGQPEFGPPGCLSFHVLDEAIAGVTAAGFSNAAVIFGPFVTDKMIFAFCADFLNPTLREAER